MELGMIGLGRMGEAMAARLVKAGHGLSVWNRTASKADPLAQIGAEVSTKTRRGSLPTTRSMRGTSVSKSPLPAITSYFAEGVSTRMVCTLL